MKTPEQKAEELIDKFMLYSVKKTELSKETIQYEFSYKIKRELAVKCAIVAVDEIIKSNPYSHVGNSTIKFWQLVKTELETLKN